MKKTLIFTYGGGRFSNQLINYAHLIAFSEEYSDDYEIINFAFLPYLNLLENHNQLVSAESNKTILSSLVTIDKVLNKLPKKISGLSRLSIAQMLCSYGYFSRNSQTLCFGRGFPCISNLQLDKLQLDLDQCVNLLGSKETSFLFGWGIEAWSLLKKHKRVVQKQLSIKLAYQDISKSHIKVVRNKCDFLVGVLIRQGDYQYFSNGRFFYRTQKYLEWMKEVEIIFSSHGKIGFLIASDEIQDAQLFDAQRAFFSTGIAGGKGHYVESMLQLSMCDLIICPPSTFGLWSSFIGDVPIILLTHENQRIDTEDIIPENLISLQNVPC